MAFNVQISGAFLQAIDAVANSYKVNATFSNPTLSNINNFSYNPSFSVGTGAGTVLVLPTATVWALYVKNLGVGTVQVLKQVTGGALGSAANSELLVVGGLYLYFQPLETAGGIIAVTLVASASSTFVELALAG